MPLVPLLIGRVLPDKYIGINVLGVVGARSKHSVADRLTPRVATRMAVRHSKHVLKEARNFAVYTIGTRYHLRL